MKYRFEKDLEKNEMSVAVVDARRFGAAIQKAARLLEQEAGCYKLTNEPYYLDTQAFLEQMADRLTATPAIPEIKPVYDRPGNLQRKMELMARHIADIKNVMDYYGWIFANDPWFAQRLQEAEDIYAELEKAFHEGLTGVEPPKED